MDLGRFEIVTETEKDVPASNVDLQDTTPSYLRHGEGEDCSEVSLSTLTNSVFFLADDLE